MGVVRTKIGLILLSLRMNRIIFLFGMFIFTFFTLAMYSLLKLSFEVQGVRNARVHSRITEWHARERIRKKLAEEAIAASLRISTSSGIRIKIIANNRLASLKRLVDSLLRAFYGSDIVPLEIFLEAHQSTNVLSYISTIDWPFGPFQVHARHSKGGLVNAVVESWYPTSGEDFAVILEDDVEVSPHFYSWLKECLHRYAGEGKLHSKWAGISLYTPRKMEFHPLQELYNYSYITTQKSVGASHAFLHQLPCSWGALYFPHVWAEFRMYIRYRSREGWEFGHVNIPRSRSNGWRRSWKKYMIELFWLKGYFLLYPNFPNQTSFSTNHLEVGEHIGYFSRRHRPEHYTVPLLQDPKLLHLVLANHNWDSLSDLPLLDLYGQLVPLAQDYRQRVQSHELAVLKGSNLCRSTIQQSECKDIDWRVGAIIATTKKYTAVFMPRKAMAFVDLLGVLEEIASSTLVDKIFVICSGKIQMCPSQLYMRSTVVISVEGSCHSTKNRFLIDMRINTQALLVTDGESKMKSSMLDEIFYVWQKFPNQIVVPSQLGSGQSTNRTGSRNMKFLDVDGPLSCFLSPAMGTFMVQKDYFYEYRCGAGQLLEECSKHGPYCSMLEFTLMVQRLLGNAAAVIMVKPRNSTFLPANRELDLHDQHIKVKQKCLGDCLMSLQMSPSDLHCKYL